MATSGQGIWTPLGYGDNVRDYRHAARIFGSNDFARAPKNKYNFYVTIVLNPTASADAFSSVPDFKNELSYLVKNIEMPKFELEVQDLNQYNKKVIVQRQIKYNPITIKFHDDNTGTLRRFWESYYSYYYMDGRYTDTDFDYTNSDLYKSRRSSRWGLDTKPTAPYISHISIYSMYHGRAQRIMLMEPFISNFTHDSHDYSDGQGLLEATATFHYTSVLYDTTDIDATQGIEGFGQAAPETYDTEYSNLTNGSGYQVDPQTGELYDPVTGATVLGSTDPYNNNPNYASQYYAYNKFNPSTPNYISNAQLSSILYNNQNVPVNSNYLFPVANPVPVVYTDFGAVPLQGQAVFSDGQVVYAPSGLDVVYPVGSWQQALYLKGYSQDQIGSANSYIKSSTPANNTNLQQLAETYIKNPNSSKLANTGKPTFGQPASKPTKIDFSNPTASTQPVYNSQDWRSQLSSKGYTKADIELAARFLSGIKVQPGVDLSSIASNYIKNSKKTGSTGTTNTPVKFSEDGFTYTGLTGPSYNPVAPGTGGSGNPPNLYKNL